jgi:ABC-type Mn2+/Zn2+ transport system ATPase subunit
MTAALQVEHVSVSYNGRRVLEDITFSVQAGERVAVVGPNGAGKSTLFRAILGLVPLEAGRVQVLDAGAPAPVGYLSQRLLVDWRFPVTAFDVVMMGRVGKLGWLKWYSRRDKEAVWRALEMVGMREYADSPISELSGGQQQRVFIARALAQEAKLLLLDEPFTGLDLPSQEAILRLMEELRAQQITILFSTHDLALALEHFDQLALLNRRLIAYGPPRTVITSENLSRAYGGKALWRGDNYVMVLGDIECCGEGEHHGPH